MHVTLRVTPICADTAAPTRHCGSTMLTIGKDPENPANMWCSSPYGRWQWRIVETVLSAFAFGDLKERCEEIFDGKEHCCTRQTWPYTTCTHVVHTHMHIHTSNSNCIRSEVDGCMCHCVERTRGEKHLVTPCKPLTSAQGSKAQQKQWMVFVFVRLVHTHCCQKWGYESVLPTFLVYFYFKSVFPAHCTRVSYTFDNFEFIYHR